MATISQLPTLSSLTDNSLFLVTVGGTSYVVSWAYMRSNLRGYSGSQGVQGVSGFLGSRGYTGSKGSGFTGSAGPQGPAGGYTGSGGMLGYTGSGGGGSVITLSTITQSIIPSATDTYDLGSTTKIWRYGYFAQIKAIGITDYNGNSLAGSRGYTGSNGSAVAIGYSGSRGSDGSPGGFIGSSGFVGSMGFVGSGGLGYSGSRGITGFYGSQGTIGYTGSGGGGTAGSGLSTRQTITGTATNLANNATANLDITGFKSYALYKIATTAAAWVRIYVTSATRSSDASRTMTNDPIPGTGIIAEVITTGGTTQLITPACIGYNDDSPNSTNVYVAVTNLSGTTANIGVTLTVCKLEV